MIFVSAIYREEIHSITGIERGAVDFIVKPIVPEILLGKVRIFLNLYKEKADLVRANRELQVTEKTLRWELLVNESLSELANQLITTTDMKTVADSVHRIALSLTGSRAGCICEMNKDPHSLEDRCAPLICSETLKDPCPSGSCKTSGPEPLMVVSALYDKEPVGKIILADPSSPYTEQERGAMEKVAAFFALAVQRNREERERRALEKNLLEAEKMRAIGQLAGGVAHDFNNRLAVIMGNAEICLQEEHLTPAGEEQLNQILDVAESSGALTRKLLAYARKESLAKRPLRPVRTVRDVINMIKRIFDKNITLQVDLQGGDALVMGDSSQLYTAVLNIALNSRDAMPDGGELRIRTALEESSFLLEIQDTGIGIAEEDREKIFDPFYSTKERWKGTGLGLSAVQGIVKMHHGRLELESEEGAGTSVKLYFPLYRGSLSGESEGKEPPPGLGIILFAEDDDFVAQVGTELLQNAGFTVIPVSDGPEAVDRFKADSQRIDLVILDIMMPRMDGWETLENIRRIDPQAKVIMVAESSQDSPAGKTDQSGADGILFKPFQYQDMLKLIGNVLSGR